MLKDCQMARLHNCQLKPMHRPCSNLHYHAQHLKAGVWRGALKIFANFEIITATCLDQTEMILKAWWWWFWQWCQWWLMHSCICWWGLRRCWFWWQRRWRLWCWRLVYNRKAVCVSVCVFLSPGAASESIWSRRMVKFWVFVCFLVVASSFDVFWKGLFSAPSWVLKMRSKMPKF